MNLDGGPVAARFLAAQVIGDVDVSHTSRHTPPLLPRRAKSEDSTGDSTIRAFWQL